MSYTILALLLAILTLCPLRIDIVNQAYEHKVSSSEANIFNYVYTQLVVLPFCLSTKELLLGLEKCLWHKLVKKEGRKNKNIVMNLVVIFFQVCVHQEVHIFSAISLQVMPKFSIYFCPTLWHY